MDLAEFNGMAETDAAAAVSVWAAVPSWVTAVVAGRPYPSVARLTDTASALAGSWTRDDLDAALAHHPRIGERPPASGAEADASAREQAAMSGAAADVATGIAVGNAAYERRFGRVFLIRAAGRSPECMLDELGRRLTNDDGAEASEALGQLTEIALLRLRSSVNDTERISS